MRMSYAQADKVYRHLSDLKEEIGTSLSRRDRALVMIQACIANGFDTRNQILKGLRSRGLAPTLFLKLLDEHTGDVPAVHLWRCDEAGCYHLHDQDMSLSARMDNKPAAGCLASG